MNEDALLLGPSRVSIFHPVFAGRDDVSDVKCRLGSKYRRPKTSTYYWDYEIVACKNKVTGLAPHRWRPSSYYMNQHEDKWETTKAFQNELWPACTYHRRAIARKILAHSDYREYSWAMNQGVA